MVRAVDGSNIGGTGGNAGVNTDWNGWTATGGVGNPGGQSYAWTGSQYIDIKNGANGTGGLLVIFANSFNNQKDIQSNGITNVSQLDNAKGGSSGGGSINIFYHNLISKGNIQAKGGDAIGGQNAWGGAGGTGSITMGSITTGSFVCEYKNY